MQFDAVKAILVSVFLSFMLAAHSSAQSLKDFTGQFPATVVKQYKVPVAMRDGIDLSTDIYLPDGEGVFPTLLVRDMYSNGSTATRQRYAKFATANGYAFVFQSVRGRYSSEGDWYPYFQEIEDGDDTLTWIAQQSWSNGKVGMFGSSYLASVQWLAALGSNPALKAIVPAVSPGNYYRDVAYPGGAFSLLSRARWGLALAGKRTITSYPIDWVGGIDHLPIETLPASLGFDVPHFQDWLKHPTYDGYWAPLDLEKRASEMNVPALNIGGWYDVFLRSTIGSYSTMKTSAISARARSGQRMIIGPWVHGWNVSTKVGDLEFGPASMISVPDLLLAWFDHWLKDGEDPGLAPVRLFVMGDNIWRDETEWPLARATETPLYLTADQALSWNAPVSDGGQLMYRYDPADPVPTVGGNIMESSVRGPRLQDSLEDRGDILRFTGDPVTERTEITGPIKATLYATTSAKDTDFMVKLVVLKADGTQFNLQDGVIRARYRKGFDTEKPIKPGKAYRYDIDMWATSYALHPGDRLRVDVTSSNFPRLARNLNTGGPLFTGTEMMVADQTIHLSKSMPSQIILPLVPNQN